MATVCVCRRASKLTSTVQPRCANGSYLEALGIGGCGQKRVLVKGGCTATRPGREVPVAWHPDDPMLTQAPTLK